jgi:drug/metabolite transporter (DMT)-like permease
MISSDLQQQGAGAPSPLMSKGSRESDSLLPKADAGKVQMTSATTQANNNSTSYSSVMQQDDDMTNLSLSTKDSGGEEVAAPAEGKQLVSAFCAMLVFSLGNRIFGRLETYPMHNYPLFMNILSVLIYIPASFAYIIPAYLFTDIITKEQLDIPQYKFAIMGALDSIAGIMAVFATNFIPNAGMIVLVQQSAIPISMIISFVWLAARYTKWQYMGATITLMGILIVMLPDMLGGGDAGVDGTADSSPKSNSMLWYMVLVFSCVPMCFSSVYKEKALGEVDIDVVYLNGWVAVYQFLFAIPLCFPSAWVIGMETADIMPNMMAGMKCYFGENTVLEATASQQVDDCTESFFYVTTYLAFNLVYNILMIVILKLGSANILWLASTAIVPVSNVAFSLKIMPGNKPMKDIDFVSLVVVMIGLVVYRFMPQFIGLWLSMTGQVDEELELTTEKARRMVTVIERKQANFIGLNQMESLNAVFDTRLIKARDIMLLRSPQQIRSSYLVRLGIAPSPLIDVSPRSRHTPGSVRRGSGGPSYLPNLKPGLQKRMSEGKYIDALKSKKLYKPVSSQPQDDGGYDV